MTNLKKIMALLLAVCMLVTVLAACGNGAGEETKPQGDAQHGGTKTEAPETPNEESTGEKVVTMGSTAPWEALHPLASNRDQHVAFLYPIYESWVTLTNEGEIIPRLFESWEQDAENPRILYCKLNQKATWSDGTPITAHDIVFTMELGSDPDLPITTRQVVTNFVGTDDTGMRIEGEEFGVTAVDDYTVKLHYKDMVAPTVLNELYCLRYTFTLPKHILGEIPVESVLTDPFWENPVTSGAFTIDGIISGERIEYVARDDYYLGRPQMDRLIIRVVTADNMLSAYLAGEIDCTTYGSAMSLADYEMVKEEGKLSTFEAPGFGNNHVLINNQTMDQNARLAMDCAIDKQTIIDGVLYGYARPAISAIVPENPYRNTNVSGNPFDVELAKEYLSKSNYDTSRPVRLLVASTSAVGQQMSVLVQQNLAAIGLNVSIETYDSTTVSSMLFAGDYDIALMQSASNPFEPSESKFYFQELNRGWLNMPDMNWEDLYNKAAVDSTLEKRKVYYDELQERLVAEVPMIFLYHPDVLFVYSDKISGMDFASFSLKSWRYEEWEVK